MKANKVQIGTVTVEAKEWRKGDQHRVYFQCSGTSRAHGCWDVKAQQWMKVHGQFNYPFTDKVREAFGL